MTRSSSHIWTSDIVIGAAIALIGVVAVLVRLNLLIVQWRVELPSTVVHLWPLLLIGAGILLLFDEEDPGRVQEQRYFRGGER